MSSPPIVLASTSLFRRDLFARLGLPFETANPDTDETAPHDEAPAETALRLSEAKARAVASRHPGALIIGSDQVAFLGGQIFGKPGTHENAVKQLKAMRGHTINFCTGLCLLNASTGKIQIRGVPTRVTFRGLTDNEIENYVRKEKPFNCAGSAKSEGLGISLIAKLEGEDPNALIGLPLITLCEFLRNEKVFVI